MTDMLKTGANPLWNSYLGGWRSGLPFTGFKVSWWCFGGMQCRIFPTGWSWSLYDFAVSGWVKTRSMVWWAVLFSRFDEKNPKYLCHRGFIERPQLETSKLPDKLKLNQFPLISVTVDFQATHDPIPHACLLLEPSDNAFLSPQYNFQLHHSVKESSLWYDKHRMTQKMFICGILKENRDQTSSSTLDKFFFNHHLETSVPF